MTRAHAIFAGLVAIVLFTGALPPDEFRTDATLEPRLAALKTVGVVEPVVDAYELGADGRRTLRPEWSEAGRASVRAAVEGELAGFGWAVKRVEVAAPVDQAELREARLLFEAVGVAIVQATFTNLFPGKEERFDYSLGDLERIAAAAQVDALVFTQSVANISSAGRAALQLLGAGSGVDWLILAIVDRNGDVLWFGRVSSTISDVRKPEAARALVHNAIVLLPRRAP